MRTVASVTVDRSDAGIYLPVWKRLRRAKGVKLRILASGTHLSPSFGRTEKLLAAEGFPPDERIKAINSSYTSEGAAKAIGLGTIGFARSFARARPDLLLLMGDRFEMFAAAVAALPFRIPVAHLHGGERTYGAMDNSFRHAMTKLSHLHFASTAEHKKRLERMGEEPWRITVSGAPALDNVEDVEYLDRRALEKRIGLPLDVPPILVTFHPATLEKEDPGRQMCEILAALDGFDRPIVFSRPNADPRGGVVLEKIRKFVSKRVNARLVDTLGTRAYFSLLKIAGAMAGNSSSGLIEAPSFGLPVVNVGSRQGGRTRGANVIDVPKVRRKDVAAALRRALDPKFKRSLRGRPNPYHACRSSSDAIVKVLRSVRLDSRLIMKKFYEGAS